MATRSFPQLPGYEVVSRLGRGAHATISLALERGTRRKVAIKHVVRRGPDDDRFVAQAETEHEVASGLNHPYLRKCYEILRIKKWLRTTELFLIMEYFDGETLEHRCPTRTGAIVTLFRHVAEGLHAMHSAGFAHADIKPNNILLNRSGDLKIIDFGQSCRLGHRKDRVQGTPDYIAPEQVQREPIDQRTDIFNLGATLYWILTGKAFKTMLPTAKAGDRVLEIESRRGNDPPHELNARIPVPLSRLVMECCETRPADRPRDMRQFISRLEMIQHLLEKKGRDASEAIHRTRR